MSETTSLVPATLGDQSTSGGKAVDLNERMPIGEMELESPGGWSGDSDYSNEEGQTGSHSRLNGLRVDSWASGSAHSGPSLDYRALVSDHGEVRRGLLDPSTNSKEDRWDVRGSITSQSTQGTYRPDEDLTEMTPIAPVFVERTKKDLQPPGPLSFEKSPKRDYPSRLVSTTKQTTPTRPLATPSASGYTPTSGRIPFTSPVNVYRTSIPGVDITVPSPQSAPAWQSDFGKVVLVQEEETIKSKGKRTTLPATPSTLSGTSVEAIPSPEKKMLSPEKYRAESPDWKWSREPSPGRSPEPPPRSTLRAA